MKKSKGILCRAVAVVIVIAVVASVLVTQLRKSNAEMLSEKLSDPSAIFNGSYDVNENTVSVQNGHGDTEIVVSFTHENAVVDEKNITADNATISDLNVYYIKGPLDEHINEETNEQETIWYLYRYDGKNSLLLLDENNEEIGKLTYSIGEKDFFGKAEVQYTWESKEGTVPVYKASGAYINFGAAYLRSKYYSGRIN